MAVGPPIRKNQLIFKKSWNDAINQTLSCQITQALLSQENGSNSEGRGSRGLYAHLKIVDGSRQDEEQSQGTQE